MNIKRLDFSTELKSLKSFCLRQDIKIAIELGNLSNGIKEFSLRMGSVSTVTNEKCNKLFSLHMLYCIIVLCPR